MDVELWSDLILNLFFPCISSDHAAHEVEVD